MPHSARKLPADLQAAMLKPDKPGPSIGKRRTKHFVGANGSGAREFRIQA